MRYTVVYLHDDKESSGVAYMQAASPLEAIEQLRCDFPDGGVYVVAVFVGHLDDVSTDESRDL